PVLMMARFVRLATPGAMPGSRRSLVRRGAGGKGSSEGCLVVGTGRLSLSRQAFGRLNRHEFPIKQQIVDDFQRAGDEERQVDERGPGKPETDEKRTGGRTDRTRHPCYSSRGRSLLRTHDGHDVGLPG